MSHILFVEWNKRFEFRLIIESLMFDYQKTGEAMPRSSNINATMITRPMHFAES